LTPGSEGGQARACPVCCRPLDGDALRRPTGEVLDLAEINCPGWHADDGMCASCEGRFSTARDVLRGGPDPLGRGLTRILPTGVRLGARPELTGRGVTIAFLDAGFFAHPDLVEPRDRILRYHDITSPRHRRSDLERPNDSSWHGMMTSVAACGNGRLSNGLYRGLASEADLVLVKCGKLTRVVHDDIRKGLDWVIRNRRRYGIRVVNISVGGDYPASYHDDSLSRAVERATRQGILVCAASGNLGPGAPVLPPASAPAALTVGGLDDKNRLAFASYGVYHSSFGPTLDGLQKPELIAPGIWVAAPILPGTPTADRARLLVELASAGDEDLQELIAGNRGVDPRVDELAGAGTAEIRARVELALREDKVISEHYKHVDGTSFAAPIAASLAAQLLEVRPGLTPQQVKFALIKTARRIANVPVDRQGWGIVDPAAAVKAVLEVSTPDC